MPRQCSIPDCFRIHQARGWCDWHYHRWLHTGNPLSAPHRRGTKPRPVAERFWEKVNKTSLCWLWTSTIAGGYGVFRLGSMADGTRRRVPAHRFAYEQLVGPIPEGFDLDHLCRVRNCVNPEHLEPVTRRENLLRGVGIPALNAAKTHCKRGHPLSGENLIWQTNGYYGARQCRICIRERTQKHSVQNDT